MKAKVIVPDLHFPCTERQILQAGGVLLRTWKNFSMMPAEFLVPIISSSVRRVIRIRPLSFTMRSNCPQLSMKRVTVSLVLHLLGNDESPCKRVETAGRPAALFRGLGQEQVTGVLQIRAFVEMPLETAAQKTQVFLADVRPVTLFDEEVLLCARCCSSAIP